MLDAPKLNPATILGSSKIIHNIAVPSMPIPTTVVPITPPLEKATRKALFKPCCAAAAVLILDLTAIRIPTNPVIADAIAPTK